MPKHDELHQDHEAKWGVAIMRDPPRLACSADSAIALFWSKKAAADFRDGLQAAFDHYANRDGRPAQECRVVRLDLQIRVFRSEAARRRACDQ